MNPFKANGHILPIASINSVYVDHDLAIDVFRPQLLIEAILNNRDTLMICPSVTRDQILYVFNDCLASENKQVKEISTSIAREFGKRLAKVILTLKSPSVKSTGNRPEWTPNHWDYWKRVERLYLVGGLTSPILTNIFYHEIHTALLTNEISDFTVTFIEGSTDLGTKGLTTLVEEGESLIFDFGQTNIKRRHHVMQNHQVVIDTVLDSVKSDYLLYKDKSRQEINEIASKLDQYIQSTIISTMKEVNFNGKSILISIANYVNNGMIYSARGGYGKLSYLADNYQKYLTDELSKVTGKGLDIRLFHDTSAMALNFSNEKCTAVISLGTAFGVAFPE